MSDEKTIIQQVVDFWWVIVSPVILWVLQLMIRWAFSRVIKSYTDDLDQMIKRIERLEKADYLPREDADVVVKAVQDQHTKMSHQTREDFKHLSNLIVDTNERVDKIYELLVKDRKH